VIIVGICGSSSPGRSTRALIDMALEGARATVGGVSTTVVDLADVRLQFADGRPVDAYDETTRTTIETVAAADAYVIGSPMYRGSMTGALKNLLDLLPAEAVEGKAAALVATGGSAHHYLGVELGLRAALAFFRMHTVPGVLYEARVRLEDGRLADPGAVARARTLGADLVALQKGTRGQGLGPRIA